MRRILDARATAEQTAVVVAIETHDARTGARQPRRTPPPPPLGAGTSGARRPRGTLGELLKWWLKEYVVRNASSRTVTSVVNLRLINSKLAALRLIEVTPGEIERHLQNLAEELGPNSFNHLRAYLSAAFNEAKRARIASKAALKIDELAKSSSTILVAGSVHATVAIEPLKCDGAAHPLQESNSVRPNFAPSGLLTDGAPEACPCAAIMFSRGYHV